MKPIMPSQLPSSIGPAASAEPRPLVLYVEDGEENRQVAAVNLGTRFHLLFATDDREACAVLTRSGKALSVILMDIELQGSILSGIELCKLIRGKLDRATLPDYARDVPVLDTPVLFITAFGSSANKNEALQAGGNDLLAKPVDFISLRLAMIKLNMGKKMPQG